MISCKDTRKSLIDFTDDVRIPECLIMDGVTEFTGCNTEFVKEAQCMCIQLHTAEQGHNNQNYAAESEIGLLTRHWKLRMNKKQVPK